MEKKLPFFLYCIFFVQSKLFKKSNLIFIQSTVKSSAQYQNWFLRYHVRSTDKAEFFKPSRQFFCFYELKFSLEICFKNHY